MEQIPYFKNLKDAHRFITEGSLPLDKDFHKKRKLDHRQPCVLFKVLHRIQKWVNNPI